MIANLCKQYTYLLDSDRIDSDDKETFLQLKSATANKEQTTMAVTTLMRILHDYYGKNVVLLLDEYDVPIAKASDHGYYDEMMDMVKTMMSSTLKDNRDENSSDQHKCENCKRKYLYRNKQFCIRHDQFSKVK